MKQNRVIGLDVFRSNAILFVLACHAILMVSKSARFRSIAACLGIYGVEQFFVLSGFLIGSILLRDFAAEGVGLATIKKFWVRRWYRTLPNYYAFLLLNVLLAAPWHHHIPRLPAYPFFLQNFAWPMPDFFIVSWSLSIEEWFYLLFPFCIFMTFLLVKNKKRATIISILLFLLLPFLARAATSGSLDWGNGVHMLVVYRLDAIGIGVLLAFLKHYKSELWPKLTSLKTLLPASAALIVLFIVMLQSGYGSASAVTRPALENAFCLEVVDFCFALLLPWFSVLTSIANPWRFLFTWVSVLSYSLYLCNLTVEKPLGTFWACILPHPPNKFLSVCTWLLVIFLLSIISYFFIEKPFLRLRDARRPQ